MIKFLKKYENKSFEDLVNGIIWQDLPFRLKAVLSKIGSSFLQDAPSDGKQYTRKDGEWDEVDLSLKADLVGGTVPASQLPSYVDDILEFADLASLPVNGEIGKIYVTLDDNKLYRWSGSIYVEVSAGSGSVIPMQIQLIRVVFDSGGSITSISNIYNNTGLPNVTSITKTAVGKYSVDYGGQSYWVKDITINTFNTVNNAGSALIGHVSSANSIQGLITIRNSNTGAFADPSASSNNAAFTITLLKV